MSHQVDQHVDLVPPNPFHDLLGFQPCGDVANRRRPPEISPCIRQPQLDPSNTPSRNDSCPVAPARPAPSSQSGCCKRRPKKIQFAAHLPRRFSCGLPYPWARASEHRPRSTAGEQLANSPAKRPRHTGAPSTACYACRRDGPWPPTARAPRRLHWPGRAIARWFPAVATLRHCSRPRPIIFASIAPLRSSVLGARVPRPGCVSTANA